MVKHPTFDDASVGLLTTRSERRSRERGRHRITVLFVCLGLCATVIYLGDRFSSSSFTQMEQLSTYNFQHIHQEGHLEQTNDLGYCYEPEKMDRILSLTPNFKCRCRNPTKPFPRLEKQSFEPWKEHHRSLRQEAEALSGDLDVVFLGDGLVEKFRGQWNHGLEPASEVGSEFARAFPGKERGGMQALALGSTDDVMSETLWHVKHGWLPDNLKPKVIVLVPGTMDMDVGRGGMGCSKLNFLDSIVNTAKLISETKPNTTVVIHGVLPRVDPIPWGNALGAYWKKIRWINEQLEKACQEKENWTYIDSEDVFVAEGYHLRSGVMVDGIRPSDDGYSVWIPSLQEKLRNIMQQRESRKQS